MRAIGYSSKTIGRSFAVETGFIALEGTVIGASLALLTLYTLVANSNAMGNVTFSVPGCRSPSCSWGPSPRRCSQPLHLPCRRRGSDRLSP